MDTAVHHRDWTTLRRQEKPRLVHVPVRYVNEVWPMAKKWIDAAMVRGRFSDPGVIEWHVKNGSSQLWMICGGDAYLGAAVTDIERTENAKRMTIVACGGKDRQKWIHLLAELEDYARKNGCSIVRIIGRRGWVRVLPDYWQTAVVLERKL